MRADLEGNFRCNSAAREGATAIVRSALHTPSRSPRRSILRANSLSDESPDDLRRQTRAQLVGTIVAAVEKRAAH